MTTTVMRPLDGAKLMRRLGYKVFPLIPNGKTPAVKGWQEWAQTATDKKIEGYGTANPMHNWGVYCGASGLSVIDVDNKGHKNGTETLKNLMGAHGSIAKTFVVRTPTGGFHYYYKGETQSGAELLGDGVDIKSRGGYVVAPGSRIDELSYEVKCDAVVHDLPKWVEDIISTRSVKEALVIDDNEDLPEGNRNDTLARLAGSMRRNGFSREAIAAALHEENHRICTPPLPTEEVAAIAASIARYSPELAVAVSDFSISEEEKESAPLDMFAFSSEAPKREWIVEDWLPLNEISSLYGSGGTGKSLLSMQLAASVATGKNFLGLPVKNKMPVLAVFCEDSVAELHRRIAAIRSAPEFEFDPVLFEEAPLKVWSRVGLANDIARASSDGADVVDGVFRIPLEIQLRKMNKGPKLLILDTLSDIYLGDENSREKVNKVIKTCIGSLLKKYELTVLLLAHPSRAGQSTGDMLSGSTAWTNAVRNRLGLYPHKKEEGVVILERIKSNYAKSGERLHLVWELGRFCVTERKREEEYTFADIVRAVASIIPFPGGEMPVREMCQRLLDGGHSHLFAGASERTIERTLEKALEDKQKVGNMEYWFVQKERGPGVKTLRWILGARTLEDVFNADFL